MLWQASEEMLSITYSIQDIFLLAESNCMLLGNGHLQYKNLQRNPKNSYKTHDGSKDKGCWSWSRLDGTRPDEVLIVS